MGVGDSRCHFSRVGRYGWIVNPRPRLSPCLYFALSARVRGRNKCSAFILHFSARSRDRGSEESLERWGLGFWCLMDGFEEGGMITKGRGGSISVIVIPVIE